MSTISCVIIEDEPLALERTQAFVEKSPQLQLLATFDNSLDGLAYLQQREVQLLFLDVQMDELSGIELLESGSLSCQVILTTAFQQYALKGYDLNITDYLLKPFTFPRFLQAVSKAEANLRQLTSAPPVVEFIFIKTENRLEKIAVKDLIYIEGMRDYRRIHTLNKRIMTLQNFGELEVLLPSDKVCRVHKSYMVALSKIESVEKSKIIIGKQRIPISDTYRKRFFQLINSRH